MDLDPAFFQRLYIAGLGFSATALFSFLAWYHGFYRIIPENREMRYPQISLKAVVIAFTLFISIALVIVPGALYGWFVFRQGGLPAEDSLRIGPSVEGVASIVTVTTSLICFIIYIFVFLPPSWYKVIFGARAFDRKRWFPDIKIGLFTWFLCYPLVFALGNLLIAVVSLFVEKEQIDQVAVRQLKTWMSMPTLFYSMVFLIVVVVPVLEEVLFRGFLQSWMRQKLGAGKAILLTSLVFALFHFARSQGLANLELLIALLILSCYLGYLFERQRSIIAPITLHAVFNSFSILLLVLY